MSASLQDLLDALEAPMLKQAEDEKEGKKEDKAVEDDGEKEEKDSTEKKENPFADQKKEKKEEEEDEGQTKSAAELGANAAREILEKVAQMQTPKTQAQTAGQVLANALLKQANAGDVTTTNSIPAGVDANKVQQDVAKATAESDATVRPMPTSDGNGPTGTVNEIFDGLIADALAQGAASTDQVHERGVAAKEGEIEHSVPGQVPTQEKVAAVNQLVAEGVDFETASELVKQASIELEDQMEKAAAVDSLVADGVSFDDAVDLVKQAADEIAFEEDTMTKAAALEELVAQGVDFDSAIEMIKQANAGDVITENGIPEGVVANKAQRDIAQALSESDSTVLPMPTSDGLRPTGTVNEIFDGLIDAALAQGAASTDQVHERGIAAKEGDIVESVPGQVKTAKLNELIAGGMDFDSAAELVKQAGIAAAAKSVLGGAANTIKGVAGKVGESVSANAGKLKADIGIMKNPGKWSNQTSQVRRQTALSIAKNPLVLGGAAVTAGAAGGAALAHKKQAALAALMDAGVDFEKAAELVAAKSLELFGK